MPFGSCSIFNEFTASISPIEPVSIDIDGIQHGVLCDFTISMMFKSQQTIPVEATFAIPVENNMCIHSISIHKENEIIRLKTIPKDNAKKMYDEALENNKYTCIVNHPEDRVCTLNIGNFPPNSDIVIVYNVTTTAVSTNDNSFLLKFPLESVNPNGEIVQIKTDHFSMKLRTEQVFKIQEIFSNIKKGSSFKKENDYKGTYKAEFHRNTVLDKNSYLNSFIITTKFMSKFDNFICKYGKYCTVSVFPRIDESMYAFSNLKNKIDQEYVFVIDCSGSMEGGSIKNARDCLSIFIHSLPLYSLFNVVQFGSSFNKIWDNSVQYNENNAETALRRVSSFKADLGGTEMSKPLQFIFEQPLRISQKKRQVFIITDGQDFHPDNVLKLVNIHKRENRCFTIGIGHGADPGLVRGIAEISGGTFDYVYDGVDIASKVIPQLSASKSGVISDIELFIENNNEIDAYPSSTSQPTLIPNRLFTFICKLDNDSDKVDKVLLKGTTEGHSAEFLFKNFVKCHDQKVINACEKIHQFSEINDMQLNIDIISTQIDQVKFAKFADKQLRNSRKNIEDLVVSLSCSSGILSNYTSFFGCSEMKEPISEINRIFVKISDKEYITCEIPKNCCNVKDVLSSQIEEKTKIVASRQILKMNESSNIGNMIDYSALKDCTKIALTYAPINTCNELIIIKTPKNKYIPFRMEFLSLMKIFDLKMKICESEGTAPDQIRLLHGGKLLEDDNTLGDYGIKPLDTIHYVFLLRGGDLNYINKNDNNKNDINKNDINKNDINKNDTHKIYIHRIDTFNGSSKILLKNLLDFHSIDGSFSQLDKIVNSIWGEEAGKTPEINAFLTSLITKLGLGKTGKAKRDKVLATLLAVVLLRKEIMDLIDSWQLIEEKALKWLMAFDSRVNWSIFISDIMNQI